MKIQQGGVWSAGICTPAADLNTDLGLDQTSWAVTSSGQVRTRNSQDQIFLPTYQIFLAGEDQEQPGVQDQPHAGGGRRPRLHLRSCRTQCVL